MISGDRHMTVVHTLVAGQVWVLSTERLLSAFSVSVVMCAVFVSKMHTLLQVKKEAHVH